MKIWTRPVEKILVDPFELNLKIVWSIIVLPILIIMYVVTNYQVLTTKFYFLPVFEK